MFLLAGPAPAVHGILDRLDTHQIYSRKIQDVEAFLLLCFKE